VKHSIRQFLLVNLLLTIVLTTILTAVGNFYLNQKDVEEHLDIIMAVSAIYYQTLMGNDIHQRRLEVIQTELDHAAKQINPYFKGLVLDFQTPAHYFEKFTFQIWSKDHRLLLHSKHALTIPLGGHKDGFWNETLNGQRWRSFSVTNPVTGVKTVISERFDTRKELIKLLTEDDLYILFFTFPVSAFLIWFVVGRGLSSIKRVAEEVSSRMAAHLEPVPTEKQPDEIKPLVDELNKLFLRLQEAFEREKRFAADAAHELRTPLASLKAQAQVAMNTRAEGEKDVALAKLIENVNRCTHIIQQLLTMSKLAPGADFLYDKSRINLSQVTQEILSMMAPEAIEKNIELEFDAASDVARIKGNITAIQILIRNLVDNAIRYTHVGGRVQVRLRQEGKAVVLEIEDNGPGIPEAFKKRVFERFFRILGNKSTGSGLGLGIVHQICTLHQATITLDAPKNGIGLLIRVVFQR